jgi:small subunit ribosomal protein S16
MALMLMIRLQRTGRKNDPSFRFVVTDKKNAAAGGKFIEVLGAYTPKTDEIVLKADRVKYWMGVGAQTSDTAYNFLVKQGVVEGKKKNVLPKKSPTTKKKQK